MSVLLVIVSQMRLLQQATRSANNVLLVFIPFLIIHFKGLQGLFGYRMSLVNLGDFTLPHLKRLPLPMFVIPMQMANMTRTKIVLVSFFVFLFGQSPFSNIDVQF